MSNLRVIDRPDLVKDSTSKAILSTDLEAKKKFLADREKDGVIDRLKKQVSTLEERIDSIEKILSRLVD